jgi:hypothetical protein
MKNINNYFEKMLNTSIKTDDTRKYETVIIKIDGFPEICNIMTTDEFIKTFHELETLMRSDDGKYWVLYEEHAPETEAHYEVFWCIPTSSIDFVRNKDGWGWHIASGVGVVGRITLDLDEDEFYSDEDEEEFELVSLEEAFEFELALFDTFECNLSHYLLFNNRADESTFKLWKAFQQNISKGQTPDIVTDNKICLMNWLQSNWGAFTECILDNTFKYMNVTSLVLDSWKEFCEEV